MSARGGKTLERTRVVRLEKAVARGWTLPEQALALASGVQQNAPRLVGKAKFPGQGRTLHFAIGGKI
jgi:hypothetical protein